MTRENLTFDVLLVLQDSDTIAASQAGEVDGSAVIRDIGSTGTNSKVSKFKAQALIDITAIKISGNDELYNIDIQGSNESDFADTFVTLATLDVGAKEVLRSDVDSVIGRTILPFNNEQQGTLYRYIRAYITTVGTDETITMSIRVGKNS